jgi:predicted nucleic acid-binding protein
LSAYADTSFIASLYVEDSNSDAAAAEMARLSLPVMVTSLGELELENAIQLRIFRNQIDAAERRPLAAFRADVEAGVLALSPMSEAIYTEARRLASRFTSRLGNRTLDILHVAAAIVLGADSFHTFDDRQKKLAKAAGLVCR